MPLPTPQELAIFSLEDLTNFSIRLFELSISEFPNSATDFVEVYEMASNIISAYKTAGFGYHGGHSDYTSQGIQCHIEELEERRQVTKRERQLAFLCEQICVIIDSASLCFEGNDEWEDEDDSVKLPETAPEHFRRSLGRSLLLTISDFLQHVAQLSPAQEAEIQKLFTRNSSK